MAIFWNEKVFLLAPETSYGVAPTLSASDAVLATNITLTPMEGEDRSRELELPVMGAQGTIAVDVHSKLTFGVEMVGTGTPGQIPPIGKLFRGCALAEVSSGSSVTYTPVSRGQESVSIHMYIGNTRYVLRGARGTATLRVGASALPKVEFEFTGLFEMPAEATPVTPDLAAQLGAQVMVATTANTPEFTIGERPFVMRNFSLALGNEIATRFLIGSESVLITGKSELIETTVEAVPLTDFNPYALALAGERTPISLTHGTEAGNRISIDVPRAQMQRPTSLEQNQNIKEWPLRCVPMMEAGNDQFSITYS